MALKGSCPCGAVTYEVDRLAGPIGHCHCGTRPAVHIRMADALPWLAYGDESAAFDHAAPRRA